MHPRKPGDAAYQGIPTGVKWSLQEQKIHINVLEMKTAKLALIVHRKKFEMKAFHFKINNIIRSCDNG